MDLVHRQTFNLLAITVGFSGPEELIVHCQNARKTGSVATDGYSPYCSLTRTATEVSSEEAGKQSHRKGVACQCRPCVAG